MEKVINDRTWRSEQDRCKIMYSSKIPIGCISDTERKIINYYDHRQNKMVSNNKRENSEAKRMGAKIHPNSGRGAKKGDATWNEYILDYKHFTNSFSITQNVWAKVVTDCLKVDKRKSPAICLILDGKTRLAIIEWSEFERLVENDHDS